MPRTANIKGAITALYLAALFSVATLLSAHASEQIKFKKVKNIQYIATLADKDTTSGDGAQTWGLWKKDPGPRGVWLSLYSTMMATGGYAPALWKFDTEDWWLDENGLLMEKPEFPIAPGRYLVTGGREMNSVLTIHEPDEEGNQRWELSKGATIYDVTHLACRSARYRPQKDTAPCSPANVNRNVFKIAPNDPMPAVSGCKKLDYTVLIVIGVEVKEDETG